jgi:Peptidase family C25
MPGKDAIMNKAFALTAALVLAATGAYADNNIITTFKDSTIDCDYLIIAPHGYEAPACTLAQHRNSFTKDDVRFAKVAVFEDVLAAFPGSDYQHRCVALWRGLKWAKEHWHIPFRYIVLIGTDDYVANPADSVVFGNGLIPSWYQGDVNEKSDGSSSFVPSNISDDYYTWLSGANPPSGPSPADADTGIFIGRIPAALPSLCSAYVEKVKVYDLHGVRGPWKNNACAIADDSYQGQLVDPLGTTHQVSAEKIIAENFQGYLVTKRFLSGFPVDAFWEKPSAKAAILQTINRGAQWAFFFGHGSDQVLTDEHVLSVDDYASFTNDSMPFVFVALTSKNGSIGSMNRAMCQRYLFMPKGGAICYVGSPVNTYASDNELLAHCFFSGMNASPLSGINATPGASLGALLANAKAAQRKISSNSNFNSLHYFLLGDPALRVSWDSIPVGARPYPDSAPTVLRISVPGTIPGAARYCVSFVVKDSVSALRQNENGFSQDSVVAVVNGVLQQTVDVPIPSTDSSTKAIVYVWNDSMDGRALVSWGAGTPNAVLSEHKTAARAQTALVVRNGFLFLSGLKPLAFQLRIFDMRGRVVFAGEITPRLGTISIDLNGKSMAPGPYFVQLRSGMDQISKSFMHVRRR